MKNAEPQYSNVATTYANPSARWAAVPLWRMITIAPTMFFFFQAEDGIRDLYVTGVKTCALPISQSVRHFPPAVHLAVVDPGVGTARRAIAIQARDGMLVGPDNGLLPAAADALGGAVLAVHLTNPAWFAPVVSRTFHGRDVFAPVAARL